MGDSSSPAEARWRQLNTRRRRPLEWLAERVIFAVSLSAIVMVFLIFLFVAKESLPVFTGGVDSALVQPVRPVEDFDRLSRAELQAYLGLSDAEFARKDDETLRLLMEVKAEAQDEIPAEFREDKDARLNTAQWRYLLLPYQWTGYDAPAFIWQPISLIHKYNIVPLFIGSLKATLVALVFAVPLSVAAAIYVSQLAHPRLKEWLKPAIEMLAGIPSVVAGFFALIVMATVLEAPISAVAGWLGLPSSRLNALVAGLALGFAIIPVVFSIAEDALTSVPRSYVQGALALGASKWKAAWQIVLPAALPGVFAAVILGFGRAIGETMIVLMASGNASIVSWNIFDSTRTITATIAAELAEAVFGGHHYRMLFMLGTLLFIVTFASNFLADLVIHRLKARLEGRA
jgi:phosphate transport system permease protein